MIKDSWLYILFYKRTEKARILTPDLLWGRNQTGLEEVRENRAYTVGKSLDLQSRTMRSFVSSLLCNRRQSLYLPKTYFFIYNISSLRGTSYLFVLRQDLNIDSPGWALIQSNPLASASQSAGPEQLNLTLHRFEWGKTFKYACHKESSEYVIVIFSKCLKITKVEPESGGYLLKWPFNSLGSKLDTLGFKFGKGEDWGLGA